MAGTRPRGWLSHRPLAELAHAVDLLTAAGVDYCCDWVNDELPWRFANGLVNLPLNHELSDRQIIDVQQQSAASYAEQMSDAADWLIRRGGKRRRTHAAAPFDAVYHRPAVSDRGDRGAAGGTDGARGVVRHRRRDRRRLGCAGVTPVVNPRTGVADCAIAPLDSEGIAAVAAKLRAAQPAWAALSVGARCAALAALAGAVEREAAALTAALVADTGRVRISRVEVDGAVRLLRRWATIAPDVLARAAGEPRPSATPGVVVTTTLAPYTLAGVISPWNFPLTLALIDAVPALAAGCAVIVKPSEVTPRFIAPLRAAIAQVSEIAAICAVIEGDGTTGAALVAAVDTVAFTGSVATGRKVAAAAARAMIPASLELGGKDPLVVLASADPDAAAGIALRAAVVNSGQACQSIERVLVARAIAEPFVTALVRKAAAVRLNWPDIERGDIGPFILARQGDIVAAQLADAVAQGAKILTGGTVETLGGGRYLRPTVVVDVTRDMALMREETFGPVIPVEVFDGVDEAVARANDSEYGLSAAVLAGSADEAEAVAVRLNAGAVSINDAALTTMVWDAEKSAFGSSGLGASRMGDTGLVRFLRRRVLLRQTGTPLPLAAYAEDSP